MRPNSFLVCVRQPSQPHSPSPYGVPLFDRDGVQLFARTDNPKYIATHVEADGFGAYVGDQLSTRPSYPEEKTSHGWDPSVDNGGFVRFHSPSSRLTIDSDFLGTEIIYVGASGDGVFVSNRVENIKPLILVKPDYLGVNQFLLGAHTVGGRTCLEGVRQSRHLKRVLVDTRTLEHSEEASGEWRANRDSHLDSEAMAASWAAILEQSPESVLMLSAGWDSRMLLASNRSRLVAAYSHGDLTSRELRLVFELASERVPKIIFNTLEESSYGYTTVARMLDELGHAFFPHWFFAAQECGQFTDAPLTSGIYAEHLSGQYGITSLGSTRKKAINLLRGMFSAAKLSSLSDAEVREFSIQILENSLGSPWYMDSSWREEFGEVDELNRVDIERTLEDYQREGTNGLQEVFERYRLEQTQRQYYALQTRCGIAFNGFSHPYADSSLSKASIEIPYEHRIQYKLSREILRHLSPDLLRKPMAATLVSARAPVFWQEASRGLRIYLEQLNSLVLRTRAPRLGWNDFQFLHGSGVFHEYIDSLLAGFWDKERMRAFLAEFGEKGGKGYSLLDMFSKILTVDHWLRGE